MSLKGKEEGDPAEQQSKLGKHLWRGPDYCIRARGAHVHTRVIGVLTFRRREKPEEDLIFHAGK